MGKVTHAEERRKKEDTKNAINSGHASRSDQTHSLMIKMNGWLQERYIYQI